MHEDVNARDGDGRTALIRAADSSSAEAMDVLIKAGADVSAKDKETKKPMSLAEIASILLKEMEGQK